MYAPAGGAGGPVEFTIRIGYDQQSARNVKRATDDIKEVKRAQDEAQKSTTGSGPGTYKKELDSLTEGLKKLAASQKVVVDQFAGRHEWEKGIKNLKDTRKETEFVTQALEELRAASKKLTDERMGTSGGGGGGGGGGGILRALLAAARSPAGRFVGWGALAAAAGAATVSAVGAGMDWSAGRLGEQGGTGSWGGGAWTGARRWDARIANWFDRFSPWRRDEQLHGIFRHDPYGEIRTDWLARKQAERFSNLDFTNSRAAATNALNQGLYAQTGGLQSGFIGSGAMVGVRDAFGAPAEMASIEARQAFWSGRAAATGDRFTQAMRGTGDLNREGRNGAATAFASDLEKLHGVLEENISAFRSLTEHVRGVFTGTAERYAQLLPGQQEQLNRAAEAVKAGKSTRYQQSLVSGFLGPAGNDFLNKYAGRNIDLGGSNFAQFLQTIGADTGGAQAKSFLDGLKNGLSGEDVLKKYDEAGAKSAKLLEDKLVANYTKLADALAKINQDALAKAIRNINQQQANAAAAAKNP